MSSDDKVARFSAINSDVDALREHYAQTLKPADVNPINGKSSISVQDLHLSIGDFDVWAGSCPSGMLVSFTEPPDAYALYLPLVGNMEFTQSDRTIVSVPGTLLACDLAKSQAILLGENRSHIGIAFGRTVLARHLSEMIDAPVSPNFDLFAEIAFQSDDGRLAAMVNLLWSGLAANPEQAVVALSSEMLLRAIMVKLLETVPHKYSDFLNSRRSPAMPRHVRAAVDYMVAHISLPLTIEEIAREAGVSVRSLQIAFQQFKSTTPLGYLRQLRLDRARQDLTTSTEGSELVATVAKRWGFSHTGRFSALYANAFGETPRQTLARRP